MRPFAPIAIFLGLLSLLWGACGPGGGPAGEAAAELGTGTVAFVPLADEEDLGLVAGPQGGHHFIVHARISGLYAGNPSIPGLSGNPTTRFGVFTEDDEQIDAMFPPYLLGYRSQEGGWHALPSGRILQVREDLVPSLYGGRLRISVQVEDKYGVVVVDSRWIRVVEFDYGDAGIPDGLDAGAPFSDAGPPGIDAGALLPDGGP